MDSKYSPSGGWERLLPPDKNDTERQMTRDEAFRASFSTAPVADRPRTASQTQKIVERLKQGPASNLELAGIALKYTSRISDARAAGFDIRNYRRPGGDSGLTYYYIPDKS